MGGFCGGWVRWWVWKVFAVTEWEWMVGCVGGLCGGWVGEDECLFCLRGGFWWLDAFLGFRCQFFGRGGVFGRGFGIFEFFTGLGGFSDGGFIIMN